MQAAETGGGRDDRLVDATVRLGQLLAARGNAPAAELADATAERLSHERLNVVVVGAFKRGKTTLVNAMLGAEHLPAAVVPLTSVITCVTSGPVLEVEVEFEDGRRERIAPIDLARYVTEPGNPKNELGVRRVTVTAPTGAIDHGIVLVDTPGIGSVYLHNTDVARAFLSEADAAILVTSADPPISDAEREFLREVRGQTARLFVVVNKVDHLADRDRDDAVAFATGVVAETLGHEARVHAVSARRALDARMRGDDAAARASGLPAFEDDLRTFLAHGRAEALRVSAATRAARLVADELASVAVEERGLGLTSEDLRRSTEELERIFTETDRAAADLALLLSGETGRIVSTIERDLAEMQPPASEALIAGMRTALEERANLRGAARELEQGVRDALIEAVDRWREGEDRRVDALLRNATARFREETDRLVARTFALCGTSLGLELPAAPGEATLPDETRFSFDFFRVPTMAESIVPDVRGHLPGGLAKRKIEHDLRRMIPPLVDKHAGRMRHDYVRRIDEARGALQRSLEERLRATEHAIRDALERSTAARSAGEVEIRERRARLADDRARLIAIGEEIEDRLATLRRGEP